MYLRGKLPVTTSKGPRKKINKKDPRLVETLPWQCQSAELNNGQLVKQRPVGEVSSIYTYLGQVSTNKLAKWMQKDG